MIAPQSNSSEGDSQRRDVCDGVEIFGTISITHPKSLLSHGFKTRIISLAFGAQGVGSLELQALTVNGEAIALWDLLIFGATTVFLAVIPVFVVARALRCLGLAEGTAEFLS